MTMTITSSPRASMMPWEFLAYYFPLRLELRRLSCLLSCSEGWGRHDLHHSGKDVATQCVGEPHQLGFELNGLCRTHGERFDVGVDLQKVLGDELPTMTTMHVTLATMMTMMTPRG